MLKIENAYYNASAIRKLSRSNRDNLIITYVNGEQDVTDYYFSDYRFEKLVEECGKDYKELEGIYV